MVAPYYGLERLQFYVLFCPELFAVNAQTLSSVWMLTDGATDKGPVKLMQRVKIAHSFLQSMSNQFHFIILSWPM